MEPLQRICASPVINDSITDADVSRSRRRIYDSVQFECSYCPKKFLLKFNLLYHESQHKQEINNKLSRICEFCNKKFGDKTKLNKHICPIGDSKKPFKCYVCAKRLVTKHNWNQHQNIHRRENIWSCIQCPEVFECEDDSLDHERVHHWLDSIQHQQFKYIESELIFKSVEVDDYSKLIESSETENLLNNSNATSSTYRPVLNLRNLIDDLESEIKNRSSDESDDGECENCSNESVASKRSNANNDSIIELEANDTLNITFTIDECSGTEIRRMDDVTNQHNDEFQVDVDDEDINAFGGEEEVIASVGQSQPLENEKNAVPTGSSTITPMVSIPIEILSNDLINPCDELTLKHGHCDLICHQKNRMERHHSQNVKKLITDEPDNDRSIWRELITRQRNKVGNKPTTEPSSTPKRVTNRLNRSQSSKIVQKATEQKVPAHNSVKVPKPNTKKTVISTSTPIAKPNPSQTKPELTNTSMTLRKRTAQNSSIAEKSTVIKSKPISRLPIWNVQLKFDCFNCKKRFDSKEVLMLHRMMCGKDELNIDVQPGSSTERGKSGADKLTPMKNRIKAVNTKSSIKKKSPHHQPAKSSMIKQMKVSSIQSPMINVSNRMMNDAAAAAAEEKIAQIVPEINDDIENVQLMPVETVSYAKEVVINTNNFKQLMKTNNIIVAKPKNATVPSALPRRKSLRIQQLLSHQCDHCGERFSTWLLYKRHIFTEHPVQNRYKCGYCNSKFTTEERKNEHERRTHTQPERKHTTKPNKNVKGKNVAVKKTQATKITKQPSKISKQASKIPKQASKIPTINLVKSVQANEWSKKKEI